MSIRHSGTFVPAYTAVALLVCLAPAVADNPPVAAASAPTEAAGLGSGKFDAAGLGTSAAPAAIFPSTLATRMGSCAISTVL